MKTKLNLIQICLLCAAMLPAVVQAQLTFTTNNGAITITGYNGRPTVLVIPATTNGYPVTSISGYAFFGSSLTNVTIGTNVTTIGGLAFGGCASLTAIMVDTNNPSYSSMAGVLFNQSQTTLVQFPSGIAGSYTIPNSVTNIGSWAFYYACNLTNVTFGNSVTSIGNYAFNFCPKLASVTIGTNVTTIGSDAFEECSSLTSVTIPNSVTSIG